MVQQVNALAVEWGNLKSMPETHRRTNLPKLSHNLQKHLKSHEHFPAPKRTPDNINEVSKAESPKIHYYLKQHEAKD